MPTKFTMMFQSVSSATAQGAAARRIGGWTESWYHASNNLQTVLAAAGAPIVAQLVNVPLGADLIKTAGLMAARAAMLGSGSQIVGYRVQNVAPIGPAQSGAANFPGVASNLSDIPQMALLCKAPGIGVLNIRRFMLRGITDANVVEGEYVPSNQMSAAFALFVQTLGNWSFRGRDLSQVTVPLTACTTAGVATFQAAAPWAPGDRVRILRTEDEFGDPQSGVFTVTSVGPLIGEVHFANWTLGNVTGGSGRKDAVVFPAVDPANTTYSRIVTRRVGRPFVGYRGRRSKRR